MNVSKCSRTCAHRDALVTGDNLLVGVQSYGGISFCAEVETPRRALHDQP